MAPDAAAPTPDAAAAPAPDAAVGDAAIPPQRFPPLPDVEPTFDLARVPTEQGPLYVGRTEITRGDWQHITGRPAPGKGTARHPVTGVTLADVTAVLNAASEAEGLKPCYRCEADGYCPPDEVDAAECEGYRLPTLAEWRAIVAVAAPDGPPPEDRAVYWSPEREKGALPVCSRGPDAAGLCDLFGNVWEWSGERARKRVWLRTGGSWQHTRDEAENPVGHKEGYGVRYLGARPVRTPREPARVTLGAITLDLLSRSLERRDGRSRPLGDDFALVVELVGQNGGPVALDAFDNREPAAVRAGLSRVAEALEALGGDLRLVVRDGKARLYRQ
ncbi:MAG: SUMF1/EgtB/PvdO family nonheme iron enzyme [Myxococcales bacterium]|nr:SUMF1/EgtB/PvdO family nonheme iron enzyme [Myxococcales bacterium]